MTARARGWPILLAACRPPGGAQLVPRPRVDIGSRRRLSELAVNPRIYWAAASF